MFFVIHVRDLNLVERNPQIINKENKEIFSKLNYGGINFPISKKDYCKIEKQNNISINVFCYDNKLNFPVYLSDEKYEDYMGLLLISDEFKSQYVYIKDFGRFIFNRTKSKKRNHFRRCCLQCFSSEKILIEHKKYFLLTNGKQNVKLKSGFISSKNYSRQIPVPFKIYADSECILKKVESVIVDDNSSYTRKYQDPIPCSFAYKVVCVDNNFSKKVVLYRGTDAVYRFVKSILSEYNYCRKVKIKYFNENLIMSAEENERYEQSNICWICNKLLDVGDNKVKDRCHISRKYRGAAHWSCNVNCKITKKFLVIFYNSKGYHSHLIFKELSKFNVKISVIPNGLEKYMAFTINRNLVFIDSMHFMNSILDSLVKNLTSKDFKYLFEEFSGG